MNVVQCNEEHLDILSVLFNEYRMFYEQASDPEACRAFLTTNLAEHRSKLFLLQDEAGRAVAFAQLYPALCSLAMRPYHYLSDLFVVPSDRKRGCARFLMNHLTAHFTEEGSERLTLDTASTNSRARNLYESLGYEREKVYITYHQRLRSETV